MQQNSLLALVGEKMQLRQKVHSLLLQPASASAQIFANNTNISFFRYKHPVGAASRASYSFQRQTASPPQHCEKHGRIIAGSPGHISSSDDNDPLLSSCVQSSD
jgi:hypothetical protein